MAINTPVTTAEDSLDEKLNDILHMFFIKMDAYGESLQGEDYQLVRDKAYSDAVREAKQAFRQSKLESRTGTLPSTNLCGYVEKASGLS